MKENTNKVYSSQDEYYKEHSCCPKCGNDKLSSTYLGYIFYKDRPYKDENWCKCKCGWGGITDDLVTEKNK